MALTPHILVVDDSRQIREEISRYLQDNGYQTAVAEDAASARKILANLKIDLVILDVMMPGEDGISFCRKLRSEGNLPVIMLTARSDESDRILGLEMGADDYLAKPCNPRELLARIASVLRRARPAEAPGNVLRRRVRFEGWTLDVERRELTDDAGVTVHLSSGEYRILAAFLERPHMPLTRDFLLEVAHAKSGNPFDRSIDSAVSRLRRKLRDDPRAPRIIKTLYAGGYMFTLDPVWL